MKIKNDDVFSEVKKLFPKDLGICNDCKKSKADITFSDSVMSFTHGFVTYLCRPCYIKRIKKELVSVKKNLAEQTKLLKKDNERKRTKKTNRRNRR